MRSHHFIKPVFVLAILFFFGCAGEDIVKWIATAPAGSLYTNINYEGTTVLPNGRFLKPMGKQLIVAPHPFGLTLSRDGNTAVTANSGVRPFSITIISNMKDPNPTVRQIPPGPENNEAVIKDVFMGLAISPDNSTLYVAGGEENQIYIFNLLTHKKEESIDCSAKTDSADYTDGYIGDMVLNGDGSRLFAVDQIGFRLIVIDTQSKNILHNVPVGRYPFGLTLSPCEKYVYVANVGMYVYKRIKLLDPDHNAASLAYPPFAYLSNESIYGIQSDSMHIPALGDPNVPESFSVWKIDLSENDKPGVTAKIKTGVLVGQLMDGIHAVGGSSPNSVVSTGKYVFVSNGNNDCISVIDTRKNKVIKDIYLNPVQPLKRLRGLIPFGLTLGNNGKRLYVAEAGINAIGVIDVPSLEVIGHIPVGWFPSKVEAGRDGKTLIVTNAKGFGSGPNGGVNYSPGPEGTYVGHIMKGSVSILDIPDDTMLESCTKQVIENNFKLTKLSPKAPAEHENNPVPLYPGSSDSPIKHLVLIIKENRTYDQILGQYKKGKGDSTLAQYGANRTFSNKSGTRTVKNATIMPNHLELAKQFAISDNFYTDSDHSAFGHRWLAATYPNEWVETSVPSIYGGKRNVRHDSKAPGILAFVGSEHAIYPEDYNQDGSIWEHLDRNNIDFFNFGFGLQFAHGVGTGPIHEWLKTVQEKASRNSSGAKSIVTNLGMRYAVNYPVSAPMFEKSSRIYPTYNMGIPDIYRADIFFKEFKEKWIESDEGMPSLITMVLPNDHGSGERPDDGYPFRESYMADNDLALGRIVQFLSHTTYWQNMAIIVTEDDAQSGLDHIDAHRSLLLIISPYVKKGYVSNVHYSFGSIFKTCWNILGIPYLNQYDAGATDFSDLFTDKPDFTPYKALAVDERIFLPEEILTPLDDNFNWKAIEDSPDMDDPDDMSKWNVENYKKITEKLKNKISTKTHSPE